MKLVLIKTKNGVIYQATSEEGDTPEQIELLKKIRHSRAHELGKTEGLKIEVSVFIPLNWEDEKTAAA